MSRTPPFSRQAKLLSWEFKGVMVINNPLIRPYFFGGLPLDSHDIDAQKGNINIKSGILGTVSLILEKRHIIFSHSFG